MKALKLAAAAAAVAVGFSGLAQAAVDGTQGTTSSGEALVQVVKGDAVMITKVDDLLFNGGSNLNLLSADESVADSLCVFTSTGGYNVTVTSENGTFELRTAPTATTNVIPYTVEWDDGAIASPTVAYNTAKTGLAGDDTNLDCGGATSTNATITVTMTAAAFNAVPTGTYSDTLTMLIASE